MIIALALAGSSSVDAQQFRPPNPPSPPKALADEVYKYRDLSLSYNSTSGVYSASPIQKAFRLYLNMSYSVKVKNNKTEFISSIRDALALFFQVPSSIGNDPAAAVYVMSVYNSTWPVSKQGKYLQSDYTVVEFSSCVATNFSGNYAQSLTAWWSNPLNYWTATACPSCPTFICTCATLPISFWSNTVWFLSTWFSTESTKQSVRNVRMVERINQICLCR